MRWGDYMTTGPSDVVPESSVDVLLLCTRQRLCGAHDHTLRAPPQTSWVVGVGGNTTSRSVCLGLQNTHTTDWVDDAG